MSPLARSPLARALLALACAALLRAACAQTLCRTDKKGLLYGKEIVLPTVKLNASLGPEIDLGIPNNCVVYGMVLQGETATACDEYEAPTVTIYDGFSKVHISRHNPYLWPDATLQVRQYCK